MIEVPMWAIPLFILLGGAATEAGRWCARREHRMKKLGVK